MTSDPKGWSRFPHPGSPDRISGNLKMGRNMQMTMPPTTTPRNTIKIGSINDVRPERVVSISSSRKSRSDFRQVEDGQKHADDHAAHHHSEEHDQDWLDQ